jgi:hypothetical protein
MLLVAAVGCSATDPTVVPNSQMSIGVTNGTSIEVELVVNGAPIRTIPPNSGPAEAQAGDLPPLPWHAVVTTVAGRTLVALDVNSGDVHRSAGNWTGVGHRVDLSCGRLDVYSGPPMLGPMPGPGIPGDCD